MAPSELPKNSNRFRRRLEYQGSLKFRGREGEGPGAPGKEADGRRKEDEARGEVGSVGAKFGAKIGCQCIELENVNNQVLSTTRIEACSLRSLLLEALQEATYFLEHLIPKTRLPRVGLRKGKRLADSIEDPIDASQAASVADSPVHHVPNSVLIHKAVFVESQAARLWWINVLFACCRLEQRIASRLRVGAIPACSHPHPAGLERVYTKVVSLWIEIGEGTCEIEASDSFQVLCLAQRANNRTCKLKILCQHFRLLSALVVCKVHLGELD